MIIRQDLLEELKRIMVEDYGVCLEQNQIQELANILVSFFDVLIRIDTEN